MYNCNKGRWYKTQSNPCKTILSISKELYKTKSNLSYNCGHNILGLFDMLTTFSFTISEMGCGC